MPFGPAGFTFGNSATIKFLMLNDKMRLNRGKAAAIVAQIGQGKRGNTMLKTIMIGRYLSIQGQFVRTTPTGLVVVRVGDKTYAGRPVQKRVA